MKLVADENGNNGEHQKKHPSLQVVHEQPKYLPENPEALKALETQDARETPPFFMADFKFS